MQLIITDAWVMKGRTIYLGGPKLAAFMLLCVGGVSVLVAGLFYLALARWHESLPLAADAQQARVVRENLEVMARQMGELSAKLAQVEALAERVSGLAGLTLAEAKAGGRGGPLFKLSPPEAPVLARALSKLDERADHQHDLMTVLESRLLDDKLRKLMLPTQLPVSDHSLGSSFGWRPDPFIGQLALHTGLDFPADVGTPIVSAAGGLVVAQEFHPAYGNMLEVDHGNEVLTRYAHLSRSLVKKGDLVKRGQRIAEVGNTGRSTGPHLHFEVLIQGAFQNPELILKLGKTPVATPAPTTAQASSR